MDETKNKGGRPRAEINLAQVKKLAGLNCTEPEIASVLGVSYPTWKRHKQQNTEIFEAVDQGKLNGNVSLRKKQWDEGMDGNTTMLIWLGKNRLGQSDKQHIEQHQVEQLVIVTDRTNKRANGGVHESSEVSGTGSGEEIRKDISRTH